MVQSPRCRRFRVQLLILSCAAVQCARGDPANGDRVLILRDNWWLQSSAALIEPDGATLSKVGYVADKWYPVTVPRTVLAALVDNAVYPDPYYGLNLKRIPGFKEGRWLRMDETSPFYPSWWYRTEFAVPAEFAGKHVRLQLDGINYRANVWLNGRLIARDDSVVGMFRRFEFDVTPWIKPGERNCLAIEVSAPGKLPNQEYRTKQIEATTGWDDHNPQPPDLNMGIWRDVSLRSSGHVILRHPFVLSKLKTPGLQQAELTISVQAENAGDRQVDATIAGAIENRRFEQNVTLDPHEIRWVRFDPGEFATLVINNPRVWWPHPLGPQERYTLEITASVGPDVSDRISTRFGIREATTYINEEGWRGYRINGHNVLIRGGAWMTNDMLLRFTERRDRALIRYAQEANLNMLRSEGFSIRETDQFYDLCDELGVMVTQQLFGRSIPDEALAISCIEDTILRIRNHPSLVHFLGHDETFPTPTLDEAYRRLISDYIPDRTYQPHSGAFEVEDRFQTGGTRTGTRELWTYADPTRYYRADYPERAWGFAQSGGIGGVIATASSVRRMIPAPDLWPLWSEAMSFHTVIQGADFFRETIHSMNKRYGEPKDIDDFCMTGQVLNYESARAMYEAYARNKYSALGITAWKYDAAWPAAMTWHFVDWYLVPTGAYYGAKKACEPLHAQYSYDDQSIWVVNSWYRPHRGLRLSASIHDINMTQRWSKEATIDVDPDGKTMAFKVDAPANLSKVYFLRLNLADAAGVVVSDNLYWLSTTPDVPGEMKDDWLDFRLNAKSVADFTELRRLPKVPLETHCEFTPSGGDISGQVRLTNSAKTIAFFVNLAVTAGEGGPEVAPCYWEDNDFSVFPGQTKECGVVFSKADLGDAAPTLRVTGWNVAESPKT